jgi:multidrug resistance efflux pump
VKTPASLELLRRSASRKVLAGVAVALGAAAWIVVEGKAREITSQAFINAPIVVVRSPIPGRAQLPDDLRIGRAVTRGDELGAVVADTENVRVSVLTTMLAELHTRARALEVEQASLERRVHSREGELESLRRRANLQKAVGIAGAHAESAMSASEIARAHAVQEQAKLGAERAADLLAAGFISREGYEKVLREHRVAVAATEVEKARLQRAEAALRAARSGMQLDGPRGLPYVETRAHELAQELVDLRAFLHQTLAELAASQEEAGTLQAELQQQRRARLLAPVDGAVWAIDANGGDSVGQNGAVLQIIDCRAPWVDAFLKESEVDRVQPGQKVRVKALQSGAQWTGEVDTVRSGTGRVSIGQYVVDPPPEVMRRQLPVRVATARIRIDWPQPLSPRDFCGAGASVSVHLAH